MFPLGSGPDTPFVKYDPSFTLRKPQNKIRILDRMTKRMEENNMY